VAKKAEKDENIGMLVNYEYCSGCHTCEVGCKERFDLPTGEFGIKLSQNGPWQHGADDWEWNFVPIPTHYCDFCKDRLAAGKKALCEKQCQSFVIKVGPLDELLKEMKTTKRCVLYNTTNDGDTPKALF